MREHHAASTQPDGEHKQQHSQARCGNSLKHTHKVTTFSPIRKIHPPRHAQRNRIKIKAVRRIRRHLTKREHHFDAVAPIRSSRKFCLNIFCY
jgi:hypothetical protein